MQYRVHELCQLLPEPTQEQYQKLQIDIKTYGQLVPIVLYDNKILDGRTRYKILNNLGVTPKFEEYKGDDPAAYIFSLNINRRHLTTSQLATMAIEFEVPLAEEAKKRQVRKPSNSVREVLPQQNSGKTRDKVAEKIEQLTGQKISGRTISDAKTIKKEAPEKFKEVKNGEKTINQVKKEIRDEKLKKEVGELNLSAKYRVIYADPPWKYQNTNEGGSEEFQNRYTTAETHYPTMSMEDLKRMPISQLTEPNAVLFIWTTSPILPETFPLIEAWGFKYKSSFIWDKVKHNMGHYNSVRHEFLLICVKGSCTPTPDSPPKLYDSVVTEERTEHSVKPEIFRQMIDHLYPEGKRLELFARTKHAGWDSFGNQIGEQQI